MSPGRQLTSESLPVGSTLRLSILVVSFSDGAPQPITLAPFAAATPCSSLLAGIFSPPKMHTTLMSELYAVDLGRRGTGFSH